MIDRINTGYGSVEFNSEKGFNIETKSEKLKRVPVLTPKKLSKVQTSQNLTLVYKFLDEILFERVYSVPHEFKVFSPSKGKAEVYTATFVINYKYMIHVALQDDYLHTSILDEYGSCVNFEYEGYHVQRFVEEVRQDIEKMIRDYKSDLN